MHVLSNLCPLRRLQDTVDAMRLLLDPQRVERVGHKFRVVAMTPASDAYCSTLGGPSQPPRLVVSEAPAMYTNWSSSDAFPHG